MASWVLVAFILFSLSLPSFLIHRYALSLLKHSSKQRLILLDSLGVPDGEYNDRKLVGFFHPYWYVGSPPENIRQADAEEDSIRAGFAYTMKMKQRGRWRRTCAMDSGRTLAAQRPWNNQCRLLWRHRYK